MKIKSLINENQSLIGVALLLISFLYVFLTIYQYKQQFLTLYNHNTMKEKYDNSQWQQSQNISPLKVLDAWALKNKYTGWNNFVDENKTKTNVEKIKNEIINQIRNKGISDAQLYTYVGEQYISGANPTLLNPEHPPAGKYLIGMSIGLFRNEQVILLICGLISLITIYGIIFIATKNHLCASLGVFLTSTHSLFIDQLIHGPQLELFQLMFFLLVVLFLILFEKKKSILYVLLAGINYGLLLSTKTVSTYFPLFFIWLFIVALIAKNFKIRQWVLLHIIGITVFVMTYLRFFILGGTLRQFLGVQKYIILFYKQSGINVVEFAGNYLRLIFTGSWKFWSENSPLSHYSQWSITWPFIFITGVVVIIYLYKNKIPFLPIEKMLVVFIILYNMFLFIVPMFPRYLLLLFIPMMLLISIYFHRFLKYEKIKK